MKQLTNRLVSADSKLELRSLCEAHAESLFQLVDQNREYLRSWLGWVDKTRQVEDTRNFVRYAQDQHSKSHALHLALFLEGCLVGVVGVHQFVWENRLCSVGYWLSEDQQGKGVMTGACRLLIDYLFGPLGLNRVTICCGTENTRSAQVAKRLGFQREGTLREAEWVNDHFVDHFLYAQLAKGWGKK